MFLYAPQRQILPLMASRTLASSLVMARSFKIATALMICPEVQ
jgi:hypothetical protein